MKREDIEAHLMKHSAELIAACEGNAESAQ